MDMRMPQRYFTLLIRRKFLLVISLMLFSFFVLISAMLYLVLDQQDGAALMGVLSRQRSLVQQMSRDVSGKYAIMRALSSGPLVETPGRLREEEKELDATIANERDSFEQNLSDLSDNMVSYSGHRVNLSRWLGRLSGPLGNADGTWRDFRDQVDNILEAETADKASAAAFIYINRNTGTLTSRIDAISSNITSLRERNFKQNMILVLLIFVFSLAALMVSLCQFRTYIAAPLNTLYENINLTGFLKGTPLSAPTGREMAPVIEDINRTVRKYNKLRELIENINSNTSFEENLGYIYRTFSSFIPYSHIGIALLSDEGSTIEARYGICDPALQKLPKTLMGLKVALSQTSLGEVLKTGSPRVIEDLESYCGSRRTSYNTILLENGIRSSITLPLRVGGSPVGVIFFSSTQKNIYTEEHVSILRILANSIAISFSKSIFIDELLYSNVLSLTKLAETRDEDTGEHIERMRVYSRAVASFLLEDSLFPENVTPAYVRSIERFAPMHDIGKVSIRDGILLKPGPLTTEEFEEMKTHTTYGAEVLRAAEHTIANQGHKYFTMGIEIAEGHHEKWDGSGYPYGKKEKEIPLSARIVAVADVFDALTSKRPYKNGYPFDVSFCMLLDGAGTHFDPTIIQSVKRHQKQLYEYYRTFHPEASCNKPMAADTAAAR